MPKRTPIPKQRPRRHPIAKRVKVSILDLWPKRVTLLDGTLQVFNTPQEWRSSVRERGL